MKKALVKKGLGLCILYAVGIMLTSKNIYAMHIMEGFLPRGWSVLWGVISVPFIILGYLKIRKQVDDNSDALLVFAMSGAFVFVISALKLPSLTGSSSHATGIALGAILLGPSPISIIGLIVLLFQAILLAHGGLTTLGANVFSMAIVGAYVAYGVYHLSRKLKVSFGISVFIATVISNLAIYLTTAIELGLGHANESSPLFQSIIKFILIFLPTQVPLAIIEGILTVFVITSIKKYGIMPFGVHHEEN
ncbi:MAG: energy-coupling factor ABC transporter permease [Bacilli bacterium]